MLNEYKRERDSQNALSQRMRDLAKREEALREREEALARRERELQIEQEKFEMRVRAFQRRERERERDSASVSSGDAETTSERRGPVPLPSGPTVARPVPPPPPANANGNAFPSFQIHCDFPSVPQAPQANNNAAPFHNAPHHGVKRTLSADKENANVPGVAVTGGKENLVPAPPSLSTLPSKPYKFAPSAALQRRPLSSHNHLINGANNPNNNNNNNSEAESPWKRVRVNDRESVQVDLDSLMARRLR